MDRRWQLKFWGLIGAFIGLAIGLAVVLATALQAARSIEEWNREYVTWHASQVEVEFWRLLETATLFVSGVADVDRSALELRIDIMFSRITVFDGGVIRERLADVAGAADMIHDLKAVVSEQEPVAPVAVAWRLQHTRANPRPARPDRAAASATSSSASSSSRPTARSPKSTNSAACSSSAPMLVAALLVTGMAPDRVPAVRDTGPPAAPRFGPREPRAGAGRPRAGGGGAARIGQALSRHRHGQSGGPARARRRGTAPSAMPIRPRSHCSASPRASRSRCGPAIASSIPSSSRRSSKACARGALDHYDARLRRLDGSEVPVTLSARPLEYDDASLRRGRRARPHRETGGRSRDRAPARDHLSSREARGARARSSPAWRTSSTIPCRSSSPRRRSSRRPPPTRGPRPAARGSRPPPSAAPGSSRPSSPWRGSARRRAARSTSTRSVTAALELLGYGLRSAGVEVNVSLAPTIPDHLGRSRPDQPGAHQPRRQRPAGDGRMVRSAAAHGRHPLRCRARPGPSHRRRQRPRRAGGDPVADLRAVLHHQAGRHRHRHRALGQPQRRHLPWRHHRRQGCARRRRGVHRPPSARSRGAAGGRPRRRRSPRRPAAAGSSSSTTNPKWPRRSPISLPARATRIDVAGTGPEALARLEAGDHVAILSDIRMPGHGRDGTVPPAQCRETGDGPAARLRHRRCAQPGGRSSSSTTRDVRTSRSRSSRSRCEGWWRRSPAPRGARGRRKRAFRRCRPIETIETK